MAGISTYNVATAAGRVRLLLSDVAEPWVFTDREIAAFLGMEGDNVKRAAALAVDANATNELLASKVFTDSDGKTTAGDRVSDAMRKHATALRASADADDARVAATGDPDADDGFFMLVPGTPSTPASPELTARSAWPSC